MSVPAELLGRGLVDFFDFLTGVESKDESWLSLDVCINLLSPVAGYTTGVGFVVEFKVALFPDDDLSALEPLDDELPLFSVNDLFLSFPFCFAGDFFNFLFVRLRSRLATVEDVPLFSMVVVYHRNNILQV